MQAKQQQLSDAEINRRLNKLYDMALKASEEIYEIRLTDEEFARYMRLFPYAVLVPVDEDEDD